jgi:hypothetical protein
MQDYGTLVVEGYSSSDAVTSGYRGIRCSQLFAGDKNFYALNKNELNLLTIKLDTHY